MCERDVAPLDGTSTAPRPKCKVQVLEVCPYRLTEISEVMDNLFIHEDVGLGGGGGGEQ